LKPGLDLTTPSGKACSYNARMKRLFLGLVAVLCSIAQAQNHETKLMNPAEYKGFLDAVEMELPRVESALKTVDPARTNVSYTTGTQIVQFRDLCLKQIGWTLEYAAKERAKHTVSGEFALEGFLRGVFDNLDAIGQFAQPAGLSTADIDKQAPVVSSMLIRISNDLVQRIELLEKGTCP
jgi:hypothetical protein